MTDTKITLTIRDGQVVNTENEQIPEYRPSIYGKIVIVVGFGILLIAVAMGAWHILATREMIDSGSKFLTVDMVWSFMLMLAFCFISILTFVVGLGMDGDYVRKKGMGK